MVRVLVQRAESRRHSLIELAKVIPGDLLERVAPGDAWSARDHLIHALAVDGSVASLCVSIVEGAHPGALAVALSELSAARSEAIEARQSKSLGELISGAHDERRGLAEALARLELNHLEAVIPIPGARNAWGEPIGITVFSYLEQWSGHDALHEATIRVAIATRPDLSTVALTRRFR